LHNRVIDEATTTHFDAAGCYRRPQTLDEALLLLAQARYTTVAGCTLYFLDPSRRVDDDCILDISNLDTLRGIRIGDDSVRIGALATWTDLITAPLPPAYAALQQAAGRVGGPQIRNVGTIGGNLCGAAANADGMPPLLVLGAEVELRAADRSRVLPLADFLLGARRTALQPDELLTAVILPGFTETTASSFLKLTARACQATSIVSAAARLGASQGRIVAAAVAVGSCSPVARRLARVEERLIGVSVGERSLAELLSCPDDLAPLAPIDDVLASAEYRRDAAATLVRRALSMVQAALQ
jgi:CO/xanthine dehydrogenase FAD-binding subunit